MHPTSAFLFSTSRTPSSDRMSRSETGEGNYPVGFARRWQDARDRIPFLSMNRGDKIRVTVALRMPRSEARRGRNLKSRCLNETRVGERDCLRLNRKINFIIELVVQKPGRISTMNRRYVNYMDIYCDGKLSKRIENTSESFYLFLRKLSGGDCKCARLRPNLIFVQ